MTIQESNYENENELQCWVEANVHSFLQNSMFLRGFQIKTSSGKAGVPDGFAFDFVGRAWYLIENELLQHQVWPHIAEQITRFVVALKNPETIRQIRDRLFNDIVQRNCTQRVASELSTSGERLHQQVELFIEGIDPTIVIFIDRSNKDLEDMARALNLPTKIFRVQKFIVNDQAEYYSPDQRAPVITTQPDSDQNVRESDFDVVELLGGGELEASVRRFKVYRLKSGASIHIKKSRSYPPDRHYWYGVNVSALENLDQYHVSHVVFVLGDEGVVNVPIATLRDFIQNTGVSRNEDGSVRHYHVQISSPPEREMYWSQERPLFPLKDHYIPFD